MSYRSSPSDATKEETVPPTFPVRVEANGTRGIPQWLPSAFLLILALTFGGSTYRQSWPDAVVQLASVPVLLLSLSRISGALSDTRVRLALLLCGLIIALPLLQLLPLPPSLWTRLPGRDPIAAGFREAGGAVPWLPLSLSPSQTWRSALSLLPPTATLFAILSLDVYGRRAISLVLLCVGFLSVMVGLAQVSAGPAGPFRLYGADAGAQGFFLNRNHYAAFLYSMVPFAAAWVVGLAADRRPQMIPGIILSILVFASLLLGLGISESRAGVVLAIIAALASTALARTRTRAIPYDRARTFVVAACVIGALLVVQFGLVGILQRVEVQDPLQDDRWEIARVTIQAIRDFFPLGTGFGTFDAIYDMYETSNILVPTYVNNAHDDYLEILLEGSLIAAVILGLFLWWFVRTAIEVWRQQSRTGSVLDHTLSRAGSICVGLLLLHSFVDYPLRSAALASLFAYSCALMLPPPRATWNRHVTGSSGGRRTEPDKSG